MGSSFDPGSLIPLIVGGLGIGNDFGLGGNGLTSALTGIPPQELQLLTDQHTLMSQESQQEAERANIIQTLFPQFQQQVSNINPAVVNPFLANINSEVGAGNQFIRSATPDLASAMTSFQSMTPEIDALSKLLQSRMNLGSPYYQQHQTEAFTSDAQKFNDMAGQLTGMLSRGGYGSSPTGLATAAMGDFSRGAGQTMSEDYLQNLFQNENTQLTAAGMFPQVPGLRATQGQGESAVGGQVIGQGLAQGQLGNVESQAGQLALGGQGLQATKAGLLNPIPALKPVPRFPNFPVQVGASPSLKTQGNSGGGGGGGILGDIFGGIGTLFGF